MTFGHHFFKPTPKYLIDEFFNDNVVPILESMASREGATNDAYVTLLSVLNAHDEAELVRVASKYYDEKYHPIFIALHRLLHGTISKSDMFIKDILDPRLGAEPGKEDIALNQLSELYRGRVLDWMKENAPEKFPIAVAAYEELPFSILKVAIEQQNKNLEIISETDSDSDSEIDNNQLYRPKQ